MPRKGLPAKYAKMGFKKGWKAYKASKSTRKATKTRKTYKPAKTKRYSMPKKRKRSKARSGAIRTGELMGMAGYAFADKYIDAELAKRGMAENANMIKAGAGYFLRDFKGVPPIVKSIGRFMFYVNGVQFIQGMIGKFQGNQAAGSTAPVQDSNMIG